MYRSLTITLVMLMTAIAAAAEWKPPVVKLPTGLKHPYVACTPDELARVKAAYQGTGPERDLVANYIKRADEAMKNGIVYPPRGGQHNQWYQCDACQIALKTVDDTHHQCPKCNKVYSGEPYDDVIFARKHNGNLNAARDAAWTFAITGDRQYADFAGSILKGYADRYAKYPYHDNSSVGKTPGKSGGHLFEQTLNESMVITWQVAPAYDLIFDTLSADDRRHIEQNLIRPMLVNIEKHRAGKNNWQTWHNAAFITGGAVIGDESWVKRAIEEPANGFLYQMGVSVSKDGMWYENSWGYHFYTLHALVGITESARRIGIDLWNHPSMKAMFTLPVRYTMPDGSLPRYGDDVNSSALKQPALMAPAAAAYKDPALAGLVVSPTIESILLGLPVAKDKPVIKGSEVFDGAGHAILRTEGEAGLAAAITFGEFGGFHGHFDKLSFVLFGYGKELGVDPGRAASQAYRLPIHKNWYRATISHNAVVVDGQSQDGAEGKLLAFEHSPTHAAVIARCETAYKGIDHRRLLLLTRSYLLVVDRIVSDQDRRFDWIYHHRGQSAQSPFATEPSPIAEPYVGNEYLQDVLGGKSDQPIAVDFQGEVGLRLLFNAQPASEIRTGHGPGKSVEERIPVAVLTRRGREATFAAVLEPTKGQPAKVSQVEVLAKGTEIRITREGGVDRVVLGGGESLEVFAGDKKVLPAGAK